MLYRKLGSSNIDVSVIGLGAWAIGGWMWGGTDEEQSIRAIHEALDQGINLIDTAAVYGYGRSEEIVGRALRGRREQVVLATKCGLIWDREEGEFFFHADEKGATPRPSQKKIYRNLRPQSIREELQRSLARLETDHVDLYQTHWQDPTTPIADTIAALLELKQEGKIRAIGVSNASLEHLRSYGPIDADQEKYSLLDRDIETNGVLDFCRQNNIAMLAYSPLANGLLTGKMRADRVFPPGDLRRGNRRFGPKNIERINALLGQLQPMAQRHRCSIGQLIIAATFSQPGITCVLCGARDPEQARENAQAGAVALDAAELAEIRAAVTDQG